MFQTQRKHRNYVIVPKVSVNNEVIDIPEALSLNEALQRWNYHGKKCAVAINSEFIPRARYQDVVLAADDKIDIVVPVGGG